jgi:glyoxylase-like metal-dependent hydrolase (beta-lactamase superfamily II)
MSVFGKATLVTALLAGAGWWLAQAQQKGPGKGGGKGGSQPVQPIQQLKPGLFLVAGAGANSLIRVTPEGSILVDTKLPGEQNYNDLMQQIQAGTGQPVKLAIVTHHHADHTGNTARFLAAGVPVVAHEGLKKYLETYNFNPKPAPPSVTYDKDYTVRLGGVEVQVHHYGRSHTGGDSVVYYPDLKVVAVSDAVTSGAGPLVDYAGGGSAIEWLQVLESVLKLDFEACVPGAGAVMTRSEVQAFKTRYETLISRATALVRQGVARDQLLAQIQTGDSGWMPRIPDAGAFYDELSKARESRGGAK